MRQLGLVKLYGTLAVLCVAPSAPAATLLDFEGMGDGATVDNFYAGGTDSQGNIGPDLGVTVSGGGVVSISALAGGTGTFVDPPSPSTILVVTGRATFHFANGLGPRLSFSYSGLPSAASNALVDIDPPPPPPAVHCEDFWCSVTMDGATDAQIERWRKSIVEVPDDVDTIYIDSALALGIDDVESYIPEPSLWAMMLLGFGAIGAAMRRRPSLA
jgi:hypothetical protein